MTPTPEDETNPENEANPEYEASSAPEIEADRQSDAMKDQLRKDVATWSAARSGDSRELATKQVPTPAVPRAPRQKKLVQPVVVAPAEKKPFKMSYDGMTDRDFMAHRIKLGAR
jgi:hypothetical protein